MSNIVNPRKSTELRGGGRGGAGNVEHGQGVEYVDGGMYRSETPGADGLPYSTGRGGYGNISEGTPRESTSGSDRPHDNYAPESVVSPNHGENVSGGRGGAGNIGDVPTTDKLDEAITSEAPYGKEPNPKLEKRRMSSGMSHLGLADKMKFGILSMMKKD